MAGNSNSGRRETPFANALRMELAAAGPDHKALRAIAARLIAKATEGDLAHIIELANRTDGKPVQGVDGAVTLNADESIASLLLRVAANGARLAEPPADA